METPKAMCNEEFLEDQGLSVSKEEKNRENAAVGALGIKKTKRRNG